MKNPMSCVIGFFGALVLLAGSSQQADASLIGAICNDIACAGADDFVVLDNGVGDTIGLLGALNFSASAYGYTVLVNTSQSKPVIGSGGTPQLDLNFAVTGFNAAVPTLFLYASDTDFTTPLGVAEGFTLNIGGTQPSGSTTGRAWGGKNNSTLSFVLGNLFATVGPLTTHSYSSSVNTLLTPVAFPYSLTLGVAVMHTSSGGTTTGDLSLSPASTPEPATFALFGLGLAGIALSRVLRRSCS